MLSTDGEHACSHRIVADLWNRRHCSLPVDPLTANWRVGAIYLRRILAVAFGGSISSNWHIGESTRGRTALTAYLQAHIFVN